MYAIRSYYAPRWILVNNLENYKRIKMRKVKSTFALICVGLLFNTFGYGNKLSDPKLKQSGITTFDASLIRGSGVEVLNGYSAIPQNGVLSTFDVKLPEIESVVYFSTRITSYNVCYTKLLRGIQMDIEFYKGIGPGRSYFHAVVPFYVGMSYNFV